MTIVIDRLPSEMSPEAKLEKLIHDKGGVPCDEFLEAYKYFDRNFFSWFQNNREAIDARRQEESRKIVATSRFTVYELVGKGSWGNVYRARDNATTQEIAIKVLNPTELAKKQMKERNMSPFEAMKNEAGIAACSHVVPRSFEIDENGMPFIVMPYYDKFLSNFSRGCPIDPKTPELKETLDHMLDIAKGLGEMHRIRKRTHGDLKLDNIAIDESGNLLLSDLGTSTCANFGWSISPRDNMGCVYTRAPECFKEKSHPNERSDNYAWACIAYKLITGKYPLEEELNNSKDPEKFFDQLGQQGVDKLLQRKVRKNIPKKLQKIIGKNLRYNTFNRDYNGNSLTENLEDTIENMSYWKSFKRHTRNALMYVTLPIALVSLAAYNIETHEPTELKMPPTRIHGCLYPNEKQQEHIEFESEEINDLPEPMTGMVFEGGAKYAKACTNNRNVAYLVKCHSQAVRARGMIHSEVYSDNQFHDYMAYKHAIGDTGIASDPFPGTPWIIWSRSVEYALTQSKHDGKVDLEDVCAISRVGLEKVDEAKRISKSFDYKSYRDAKYSNGSYVIPRNEKIFIDTWLSYFHADTD